MKKFNFDRLEKIAQSKKLLSVLFICLGFLCIISFFSCSSTLVSSVKVDPFDTLDQDSLVYMRIPVNVHTDFTKYLIKAFLGDVPESTLVTVTDRLQTVYAGISSNNDKSRFQIACDASISTSTALTLAKSSAWQKTMQNINTTGFYPVLTYAQNGVQLSVPTQDIVCLAKDITPLLNNYDNVVRNGTLYNQTAADGWKDSDLYSYVNDRSTDNIRFYLVKPISFITNLLGTTLSSNIFQLNYVRGEIVKGKDSKYSVNLELEFKKSELISRAISFLGLALGLTNSQIAVIDSNHLVLNGIKVSNQQLQNMLGLPQK